MSKRATLVIDIQNEYFPTGKLPLTGVEKASANAAKIIEAARAAGDVLIHVRHEFPGDSLPFFKPGTDAVEIHESVKPENDEPVIVKNFPNSFLGTELKQMLDAEGVEEVLVIGAMSHICVEATSRSAADQGYKVTVAHDACATMDLEFNGVKVPAEHVHAASMAALAFGYATIQSTAEVLGAK